MKNTVFLIELELKLLALIVIVLPIPPNAGSIESIIGWGKINDIKNNIDDIYLNTLKSTNNYPTMCVRAINKNPTNVGIDNFSLNLSS